MSDDREAVIAALSAQTTEEEELLAAEASERLELERRRCALSPEVLAGDGAALAELDQVEARLAEHNRQERLRSLAEAERANRDRQAAEADTKRRREVWRAERLEHEAKRDQALRTFERSLTAALEAAKTAIQHNSDAVSLSDCIEPGRGRRRLTEEVENRLVRRIHEVLGGFYIRPGQVRDGAGREPLAVTKPRKRTRKD